MESPDVHAQPAPMPITESERRRRRPPVSCVLCRKRKIRCNRGHPCNNCLRSRGGQCVYEPLSPQRHARQHRATASSEQTQLASIDNPSTASRSSGQTPQSSFPVCSSTTPSTPASNVSAVEVESLRYRIKQLEDRLSKDTRGDASSNAPSPNVDIRKTTSQIGGTFYTQREAPTASHAPIISRSIMHKTRLFGQSHWMNGVAQFLDILEMIEPYVQSESSNMLHDLQRCKYLGKVIKSQRTPPWPTVPTTDLPPKELADTLVDIYLRTVDAVYRTLHVPTFRRDYEAIWGANTAPSMAFVIQLKLVMAIGAAMYDEGFSLRASATRWIYEAQTWISEPQFKSRLSVQFLQTNILLLLAREIVGVGGSLVWIAAGQLIRLAMYMGLHRDPLYLPKRTTFICEMRRRLWNTILEIALQASMESGGPPLVALEDFDTQPPGNFDDEQITTEDPVPHSENTFTQMSCALALRRMFPLRLAIARSLNNGIEPPTSYEDIVRMDGELRTLYKTTCQTLQGRNAGSTPPSQFSTQLLDFIVRRYLMALHIPFFGLALQEIKYAFSRKVVVDTAVRIKCSIYPSSTSRDSIDDGENELTRLAKCGSAPFRTIATQSCFLIAAELKAQVQEEDSLGPLPLRQDLLSALDDAKTWVIERMEAGETNTKGYLLLSLVRVQIEGLQRGLPNEQIAERLAKAAERAQAETLVIMEKKAAESPGVDLSREEMNDIPTESISEWIGDWDFMMPDTHLYYGDSDTMNWVNTLF